MTSKKFRMKSWYWGNYCEQMENGMWLDNHGNRLIKGKYFSSADLEPYVEEDHGWHHSEESKKVKLSAEKNSLKIRGPYACTNGP